MISYQSSRTHYIISSVVTVLARSLVTLGSFGVLVILAAKYGAATVTDAYFIARLIPVTLLGSLGIAFNLAFVPLYMEAYKEKSETEAAHLATNFLNGTLAISFLLTLFYIVFADPIVTALAPGFSAEAHGSAVWMTRIMGPAIMLTSMHAVFDSVLNGQRRFVASALSSLFVPFCALLGVTFFVDRWEITGLAAGVLLGFAAQAMVLLPVIRPYFTGYRWSPWRISSSVSHAVRYLGLTVFIMATWQINTVVDRMFGSMLGEGAVSALGLGTAIIGLIPIVVAAPVYKVLYPELIQNTQEQNHAKVRGLLRDNFVIVAFISLPVMAALVLFAPLATELAFGYGRFGDASTMTSEVILYSALGLPTSISGILLIYFFLITRSVTIIIATFVASVAVNALFNWVLMELMGIGGIALGTSLMTLLRTGVMVVLAGRLLGGSILSDLTTPVLKSLAGAIIAAATMHGLMQAFSPELEGGSQLALFGIAATVALAGATVYLLGALILRNEAMIRLLDALRRRKCDNDTDERVEV